MVLPLFVFLLVIESFILRTITHLLYKIFYFDEISEKSGENIDHYDGKEEHAHPAPDFQGSLFFLEKIFEYFSGHLSAVDRTYRH